MTSPVKLPPLPLEVESVYVDVDGLSTYREARDCYYTMDQMRAYAEQAVREALENVVQTIERMSQEEFERPGLKWPTHMAYHQAVQSIRVVIPGSGHKPVPMDTSSGHNANEDPPC